MVLITFLFFTVLVAVGTYYFVKDDHINNKDDYFLGGRSLSGGVIAGSLLFTIYPFIKTHTNKLTGRSTNE